MTGSVRGKGEKKKQGPTEIQKRAEALEAMDLGNGRLTKKAQEIQAVRNHLWTKIQQIELPKKTKSQRNKSKKKYDSGETGSQARVSENLESTL